MRNRPSHFPFIVALLCTLLSSAMAQARDLVVYGEPTLESALKSVGMLWQARSGTRVNVFVAPTNLSLAQIERGARCDVIFAVPGAPTDEAARRKIIHADTIVRVLRNSLVLVGAVPATAPSTGIAPSDLARLIAGRKLAIADPERDPAGARAFDLLRAIGITVDDTNKMIAVAESSAGVIDMLTSSKAELGIVHATDAIGFKTTTPMPQQAPIDYVVAQARDPALDTKPFLAFLNAPEAKAAFRSAGLMLIGDHGTADAGGGRQQ